MGERWIVPRTYIGELLRNGLTGIVPEHAQVRRILDLCRGSGCLAILAALAFPDAKVDATDISRDALAVAARNVANYGLETRIELIQSDLFERLDGRRYDLILANPPYVSDAAVAAFPPEYAAEPVAAHAGGPDGLDCVRRILEQAPDHMSDDRTPLVIEVGAAKEILERDYPRVQFLWLDTATSHGEVLAVDRRSLIEGI